MLGDVTVCCLTDISDLDGGSVAQVEFPNPNDLTNFQVIVSPDSGFWSGAKYLFTIQIPALYPHEPPKVTCKTKIYHPNINLEGNVCLNILREEWKPVLDINAVIYGMIYLFYEPNPDDPLNREAADLYRNDKVQVRGFIFSSSVVSPHVFLFWMVHSSGRWSSAPCRATHTAERPSRS
jgi:ubiquitin-protein ligase